MAAVVSGLLVVAIPFDRFLTTSAITDTLMLLPLWSLQDRIGEDWIRFAAFGLGAVLAAAFLVVPRRYALALPLLVLGLWILAVRPIWWGTHGFERFSRGALFQGIRTADRDWIDQALGSGERAAFLWTGRTDRLTVNQSEFFNRAVGPVYYVTDPTPGGLPETRVRIDRRTGAVTLPNGDPVRDRFLLADSSFEPDGRRMAQDKGWGVTLWRVRTPLVSAVRVDGLYPNDTWSGGEVTYLRRRCRPGRLSVSLSSDPSLFLEPQTVVARSNGAVVGRVRLRPEGRAVLSVPVAPEPGTTRVPRRLHGLAHGSSRGGHGRRESRSARAGRALQPLRVPADRMRVAFDVSPLSHPLLGIGNYIQGSLAGLVEAVGRASTRSSRSHPRASADLRAFARRSRRSTSRCGRGRFRSRTPFARPGAVSVDPPPSVFSVGSTCSTSRTGCIRHSDPACARRRFTISCRSTIPNGRPRGRARCTGASTGTPRRPVTSSS